MLKKIDRMLLNIVLIIVNSMAVRIIGVLIKESTSSGLFSVSVQSGGLS